MPYYCCVPSCKNTGKKIFHSFPKNEKTCSQWILRTKCLHLSTKDAFATHEKVCRKHFRESEIRPSKRLKRGTIPSLHLPIMNVYLEHNYCQPPDQPTEHTNDQIIETNYVVVDVQPVVVIDSENNNVFNDSSMIVIDEDDDSNMIVDENDYGHEDQCIIQNPYNMNSSDPVEKPLCRPYDPIKRKMKYQAARIKTLEQKIKQRAKMDKKGVINYLSTILKPDQHQIVSLQIKNAGKKRQGRRYDFNDKTLGLSMYKQGAKSYRFISDKLILPSKSTLTKHSAKIRFETGISSNLMNFIKNAVSDLNDSEKYVILVWDEIALKSHLDFAEIKDYIDGFSDVNGNRSNKFARHALVFMLRGIKLPFKQPLAYYLTDNIDADELSELIKLMIEAILQTGLKVIGSVCDATSTNGSAVKKLIEPGMWRLPLGKLLEYCINGTTIIHIFDIPHLLKSVRNNLLVKNMTHNIGLDENEYLSTGKIIWDNKCETVRSASWTDVESFYDLDCPKIFKLAPKVTEEHIKPQKRKMKVKLASQIFSKTFGGNMYCCADQNQLPTSCIDTSILLLFLNELFDSLNGNDLINDDTLKGAVRKDSSHFTFWEYAIRVLKKMKFGPNLKTGRANRSNVLKHFISSIKGIRKLCKRLLDLGFSVVAVRRFNQDALENLFGCIRSYCGDNNKPNARDFKSAYCTAIVNNMSYKHSLNANCEDDKSEAFLRNLNVLFESVNVKNDAAFIKEESTSKSLNCLTDFDYDRLNFQEPTFSVIQDHISGKILRKLLAKIKCDTCETLISTPNNNENECEANFLDTEIDSTEDHLHILPKLDFATIVNDLLSKANQLIPFLCAMKNLKEVIISELDIEINFGCEQHKEKIKREMKNITTLVAINNFTRKINYILSGESKTPSEENNEIEKAAFKFRQKRKEIGKFVPQDFRK